MGSSACDLQGPVDVCGHIFVSMHTWSLCLHVFALPLNRWGVLLSCEKQYCNVLVAFHSSSLTRWCKRSSRKPLLQMALISLAKVVCRKGAVFLGLKLSCIHFWMLSFSAAAGSYSKDGRILFICKLYQEGYVINANELRTSHRQTWVLLQDDNGWLVFVHSPTSRVCI